MRSECKYSFLEAKAKLEYLCAYQERCSHDLDLKMIQWGLDSEDRSILLAHLIENNYLSEQRFAEAFVSGKVTIKRWGRNKITQELKKKRISPYSIKKGIESVDPDTYWKNILYLAQKKLNTLDKEHNAYKKRVKILRFLASKGYEMDIINDAADDVLSDN